MDTGAGAGVGVGLGGPPLGLLGNPRGRISKVMRVFEIEHVRPRAPHFEACARTRDQSVLEGGRVEMGERGTGGGGAAASKRKKTRGGEEAPEEVEEEKKVRWRKAARSPL